MSAPHLLQPPSDMELALQSQDMNSELPAGLPPILPHRLCPCLGLDLGQRGMGKGRVSHARIAVSPPFPKPAFIKMGKFKLRFGRQGHTEWYRRVLSKEASQENWPPVWVQLTHILPQTSSHPPVSWGKGLCRRPELPTPGFDLRKDYPLPDANNTVLTVCSSTC